MKYNDIIFIANREYKLNNSNKKTILIDLDGVLNNYSGNFDKSFIPEIKDGAKEFLAELNEKFELILFTTRNKIQASKWLIKNNLDKYFIDITNVKELNCLIIDDRCLNFNGDYKKLINDINSFKPWYKLSEKICDKPKDGAIGLKL